MLQKSSSVKINRIKFPMQNKYRRSRRNGRRKIEHIIYEKLDCTVNPYSKSTPPPSLKGGDGDEKFPTSQGHHLLPNMFQRSLFLHNIPHHLIQVLILFLIHWQRAKTLLMITKMTKIRKTRYTTFSRTCFDKVFISSKFPTT